MPAPSALNQVTQVGIEVTPGTAPAGGANKQLESLVYALGFGGDFQTFRASGRRFANQVSQGKEWTQGKLTMPGGPSYTELPYALSGLFGAAVITTPPSAVLTRQWVWDVPLQGAVTPITKTIQRGDPSSAGRARQASYGMETGLELKFSRDKVDGSGEFIAQLLQTAQTLTAAPTIIAQKPIMGKHLNWWMDTTGAGLGTTALTDVLEGDWSYKDAFKPYWPMVRANPSFADRTDTAPKPALKLLLAADTVGEGLVADARSDNTKFIRIDCQGDLIENTTPNYFYTLHIDMAVKLNKLPSEWADKDGVLAVEYEAEIVEDTTWGHACLITLDTTITSL